MIRLARHDEISAIFDVHRHSVSSLCTGHYSPQQIAMWLDGRTPEMYIAPIERGDLWVADDEASQIAGFVEIDGHEVSKLFVRGTAAGRGVGRQLLAKAVDAIRARGATAVYLEATCNASEFYRRHGFVGIGTGVFSRGNSGVSLEIVKMQLAL